MTTWFQISEQISLFIRYINKTYKVPDTVMICFNIFVFNFHDKYYENIKKDIFIGHKLSFVQESRKRLN